MMIYQYENNVLSPTLHKESQKEKDACGNLSVMA